MSEQPISDVWTSDDDEMVHVLADVMRSMSRHPTARTGSGYVPLVAPPLPNWSGLGRFITAYVALLLILAGFLVGITAHFWVAFPLVLVGCGIAVRLIAINRRRQEKKS